MQRKTTVTLHMHRQLHISSLHLSGVAVHFIGRLAGLMLAAESALRTLQLESTLLWRIEYSVNACGAFKGQSVNWLHFAVQV